MRALFIRNGKKEYGGYFFDEAKDILGKHSITLKTNPIIRQSLSDHKEYIFRGYIDRMVRNDGTIQIQFIIVEVVSEEKSSIDDDTMKKAYIIKKKIESGFANIDQLIRAKIYIGEQPKVALLFGSASITDIDFFNALGEAVTFYSISEQRVNMTSASPIATTIRQLGNGGGYDCIALIRGGGSGLDVFDDAALAEVTIATPCAFITAIGHASDTSLLDQVSDRYFDTPTAFGAYLRSLAERIAEDRCNSKAQLIQQVERAVQQQFEEKIQHLEKTSQTLTEQQSKAEKEKDAIIKRHEEERQRLINDHANTLRVLREANEKSIAEKQEQNAQFKKETCDIAAVLENYRKAVDNQKRSAQIALTEANKSLKKRTTILLVAVFAALLVGSILAKLF